MAEGMLGIGGGGGASLNQELIDKLKAAEKKAKVDPLEAQLESITKEREKYTEISTKLNELLEAVKPLDLFKSGGPNAFEAKVANTSGDSAVFQAADGAILTNGITSVTISQLAQKDVYQSTVVNAATKDAVINQGNLDITVNGTTHSFDTTALTYDQLVDEINKKTGMNASMEEVGSDSFRLVIKSSETGTDNALTIGGAAGTVMGYDQALNHTLTAQNMQAKIDGVDYDVASNVVTVNGGLEITATKVGDSSININDDKTQLVTTVNAFITKYNEFVKLVDDELSNADTPLEDRATFRSLLSEVKEKIFGQYGASSDKSLFNYGFDVDKNGALLLDSTKFQKAVDENFEDLKTLFIGSAENKGLGTSLKEYLMDTTFSTGLLGQYDSGINERKKDLEEEKEKAEKALDAKYQQLATQFAAYAGIIQGFESSFSGLKQMIAESTSK